MIVIPNCTLTAYRPDQTTVITGVSGKPGNIQETSANLIQQFAARGIDLERTFRVRVPMPSASLLVVQGDYINITACPKVPQLTGFWVVVTEPSMDTGLLSSLVCFVRREIS